MRQRQKLICTLNIKIEKQMEKSIVNKGYLKKKRKNYKSRYKSLINN